MTRLAQPTHIDGRSVELRARRPVRAGPVWEEDVPVAARMVAERVGAEVAEGG